MQHAVYIKLCLLTTVHLNVLTKRKAIFVSKLSIQKCTSQNFFMNLPTGEIGTKGEMGTKGEKGEIGPKGIIGGRGVPGKKGEIGLKGDKGYKGDQGPNGTQGEEGPPGPKGNNGTKGNIGDKGTKGKSVHADITWSIQIANWFMFIITVMTIIKIQVYNIHYA